MTNLTDLTNLTTITVHCPAGVSNVVCGFDILGFSLHEPFDVMHLSLSKTPGIRISHNDKFNLSTDPEKNIAGVVLTAILNQTDRAIGFDVEIEKRIKPGSGLGSSAASAAGAAVAANHLLGNIFSTKEVVEFAMAGEQMAAGARHADNIAPCISGGVNLVRSLDPIDIIQLPSPDLYVTVIHPQI